MKIQPAVANKISGQQREFRPLPEPAEGSQAARVSMIAVLGQQYQAPYTDTNGKHVVPANEYVTECAVMCDLVDQEVDYGNEIGIKQYRYLINRNFKGNVTGFRLEGKPLRDAEGKVVPGKLETFHPKNTLHTLAVATGAKHILGENPEDNMNVLELLNRPFYIDISVEKKKSDKLDSEGKPITFTNVRYKNISKVPMVKGQPVDVQELTSPAIAITFEDACGVEGETPLERLQKATRFLRKDLISKMKLARDYPGSLIEKVLGPRESVQEAYAAPVKEGPVIASQEAVAEAVASEGSVENDEFGDDLPF